MRGGCLSVALDGVPSFKIWQQELLFEQGQPKHEHFPGCCSYCTADCLQGGRPCSALWCSCTFLFRLTQRWRKASRCMRRMTCCFTVATWPSMTTLSFPAWCRGRFWVGVLTSLHAAALDV